MKITTLAGCLILLFGLSLAKAAPLLQSDDRIAVCSDGTDDAGFSAYVETYLLICSPVRKIYLEDFGWSASTASGFLARLDTDLLPYKPTVVLTSFGLGEAGDKPLDDATAAAYRKAQTDLVDALKKNGVREILVGSPRCVDSFSYHNDPTQAAVVNQARSALADIDKDVAAKEGVVYADVFGATLAAMTKAKALYGDKYVFESGRPGSPSNLVVAYAFLKALGCSGDIGSVTVNDLARGNIRCSPGQWFSFANNTLTIESSLFPFSYSLRGHSDPDIRKCFPFDDELNRYVLVVKKLPSAHAKVTWGDENRDFSAEELAAGINLPKEFAITPFTGLFDVVTRSSYDRQQQERASGQASLAHPEDLPVTAPWDSLLQNTVGDLVYTMSHAQRQRITIQPLAEPEPQPPGPIPVIVDTDMNSDIDDVAALALLNDFMDQGECTLLACLHDTSTADLSSCATIQAINAYYGHPSIPIGQAYAENDPSIHRTSILAPAPADGYHTVPRSGSGYTLKVHQRFDPTFPNDDKMPPAVDVYRKALASAADGSVVICSIGNMQNFQDLLLSQPDSVSHLNGIDLVRKKVREVVIMFNTVPQDRYLLSQWPVKVVWSIDIGNYISLGKSLLATPENNPVRVIFNGGTRQGWDPTAAWLSVRGTGDVYDLLPGRPSFLNEETHSPPGPYPNETTATVKMPADQVLKLYEDELARPPKF